MPERTIERKHGFEIVYEGRRIVAARFKYTAGKDPETGRTKQDWEPVTEKQLGSLQDLKDYKQDFLRRWKRQTSPNRVAYQGSFDEYWPTVLERDRGIKASTRRFYEYRLQSRWVDPIRRKKLTKIYREDILALAHRMRETLEGEGKSLDPRTLESILTPIQKVFTYAIREDGYYRDVNPVSAISVKSIAGRKPKAAVRVYSDEDMALLREKVNGKHRCLVFLAWYTGGRKSELLGLRWRHVVGWEDPSLVAQGRAYVLFEGQHDPHTLDWVQGTKNQIEGTVGREEDGIPLPPAAIPMIHHQYERCRQMDERGKRLPEGIVGMVRPDDRVFPDLTHGSVQEYLRRLRGRLGSRFDGSDGYEPLSLHKMRHNFGSRMAQVAPSGVVAKMMRDTIATVQKTYQHEFEQQYANPAFSPAKIMNVDFG